MKKEIKNEIQELIANTKNVYVSSVDQDGYPNIKCMFFRDHEHLHQFYFSSNCSSARATQFMNNSQSCIYFTNEEKIQALMLRGTMKVSTELIDRKRIWEETDIEYYPNGVEDEDYCVLVFTAMDGNYWYGGKTEFRIDELM